MLETSARNVLNLKMVKTKKLLDVREIERERAIQRQRDRLAERQKDYERDMWKGA